MVELSPPPHLDGPVAARIQSALAASSVRVQRVMVDGTPLWIKRVERPTLLRRLQKGNARAAFAAERAALGALALAGAPVPAILAEGRDYYAVADGGPTLKAVLRDPAAPTAERARAFAAAGRALAALHARGLSHGRPAVRDLCWDGRSITFLDPESYAETRNTPAGHARDLVIMVSSILTVDAGATAEAAQALSAYRAADPCGVADRARDWCRRHWWLSPLTAPLRLRGPGKAREFKAIPATLAVFAA